ncbi:hypothetical protein D3C76_1557100 [compost metagenome]
MRRTTCAGPDEEQVPPAPLDHAGQQLPSQVQRGFEIDIQHVVDLGFIDVLECRTR